jgi:hypothetical protein
VAETLTPRQILVELGLSKIRPDEGQKVTTLFIQLMEMRVGKRLMHMMGPAAFDALESETGLDDTPVATQRGMELIKESVPDYGQFVDDELRLIKADFITRMTERIGEENKVRVERDT